MRRTTDAAQTTSATMRARVPATRPPQLARTDELSSGLLALSESALHITVYDLLAHAYDRVAIQYYHDQGAALLLDQRRGAPPPIAPALPPTFQREIVSALLADAARAMATFFGFEEMNFLLLDHERAVYHLVVREGAFFPHFQPGSYVQAFGTGIIGRCHLERRTVLYNDVREAECYVRTDPAVRAELCVPVVLGDDVLAIIDTGASQVNAFQPAQATFIEGFARYLAPAIADPLAFLKVWKPGLVHAPAVLAPLGQSLNFLYTWHEEWRARFAQVYAEVAKRNAELVGLTELSASLSTTLRLDTILSTTVAKVAQLFSCEASWISLADEDGRLHVRALHGGSLEGLTGTGLPPDAGPQFTVFARGDAIITNNVQHVPQRSFDWTFCQHNAITRYVSVPLRVRERIIGVMNIGRTLATTDLTEQDVRLLSTFATQIALAIENADLFERSRMLGALEERDRLARDLHDTLVQSIVGILRTFDGVEELPVQQVLPVIEQARSLARQGLEETRRSVWNLRPAELERRRLEDALEQYVRSWSQRTGVLAAFSTDGQPVELVPSVESDILHVMQEALTNVARHASATQVQVTLTCGAGGICLTVADDGVGFVPEAEAPAAPTGGNVSGGLGLRGMRARAHLSDGRLAVDSVPGAGTRVLLTMPLRSEAPLAQSTASRHKLHQSHMMGAPSVAPRSKGSRMRRTPATAQHLFAHASTDRPITVVLADDHPATREGLRHALASVDTVRVIGVATVGAEAVSLVRELTPDIVLLDLQMPQGDGLWVLGQLRALGSSARVVMLTAYGGDAQIAAALNAGAVGYLQKDIAIPQLIECIRAVALGHRVFSPAIADRLRGHVGFLVNVQAGGLTPREREVLHLLAAGTRYRGIAQQLSISEATVKFHVLNLYQKLQSSSRVEALNRAREWGLFA